MAATPGPSSVAELGVLAPCSAQGQRMLTVSCPTDRTLNQSRQRELEAATGCAPSPAWHRLAAEQNPNTYSHSSAHFMWLKIPPSPEKLQNHKSATFSRKTWETLSSSGLVVVGSVINMHCKHTTQT